MSTISDEEYVKRRVAQMREIGFTTRRAREIACLERGLPVRWVKRRRHGSRREGTAA